jgi:hypothetical protein
MLTEYRYMELFLGIIAASIPCLKVLFEQTLTKLGFKISYNHSAYKADQWYDQKAINANRDVESETHELHVLSGHG